MIKRFGHNQRGLALIPELVIVGVTLAIVGAVGYHAYRAHVTKPTATSGSHSTPSPTPQPSAPSSTPVTSPKNSVQTSPTPQEPTSPPSAGYGIVTGKITGCSGTGFAASSACSSSTAVYIYLVNSQGQTVAGMALTSNGTYHFTALAGDYRLKITGYNFNEPVQIKDGQTTVADWNLAN